MSDGRCAVTGCVYRAESALEDFVVCALHDAPQTRAILERLERPGAYWAHGRPIVLPCGELTEQEFALQPVLPNDIHAWEDEWLASIPTEPTRQICPQYDLTREDWSDGTTPNAG